MKIKNHCLASLLLLSGCTVMLPDARICSASGTLSAGMDCAYTVSDKMEELSLEQSIEFLEPQLDPPRGAALCMSSEDFSKVKTAIEQACKKLGTSCRKETRESIEEVASRFDDLQSRVAAKKRLSLRPQGGM